MSRTDVKQALINNVVNEPDGQIRDTNSVEMKRRRRDASATAADDGSQAPTTNTTYPRFGPLGTRNGATTPTSPHSVVKQIIGRASEWDTMVPVGRTGRRDETRGRCGFSRGGRRRASMAD